jgi:hypothetical protein
MVLYSKRHMATNETRVLCGHRRRNELAHPWKRTEVHRFPHCVLEVKLSLPEGQTAPEWVTDLIDGDERLGFEIHKFSKFIQGTAVLYPRCVQVCTARFSLQLSAEHCGLLNKFRLWKCCAWCDAVCAEPASVAPVCRQSHSGLMTPASCQPCWRVLSQQEKTMRTQE